MSSGISNHQYFYESVDVQLDGSGSGSTIVTFPLAFKTVPVLMVIPLAGSSATVTGAALTASGFTFTVAGESNLLSQKPTYAYFAHEKM